MRTRGRDGESINVDTGRRLSDSDTPEAFTDALIVGVSVQREAASNLRGTQ